MTDTNVYEHPQHDLEPNWQPVLRDGNGAPINLQLLDVRSVKLVFRPTTGGKAWVKDPCPMLNDGVGGQLDVTWETGDPIDFAGLYLVQAELRIGDANRPRSVPSRGRGFPFRVMPDLG